MLVSSSIMMFVRVEEGAAWEDRPSVNLIREESNVVAAELAAKSSTASLCWMKHEDLMALIYSQNLKPGCLKKTALFHGVLGLVITQTKAKVVGNLDVGLHIFYCQILGNLIA